MKKMLKMFLIFSALLHSQVHAESQKPLCALEATPATKITKINDVPSYFYKVHPSGKYISYIGSKGNQLIELETGKTIPLPGTVDPVFTSDGKYLVVPMFKDEFTGPISPGDQVLLYTGNSLEMQTSKMSFYDANIFINRIKDKKAKPFDKNEFKTTLYRDEENNGVYQSVSLKKDGSYDLISDKSGVSFQNYKIDKTKSKTTQKLKAPCGNINDFPTDLPIISKDGKFLSVNNTRTKSTQIFELKEDNKCNLALDLGLTTGKVSFNKDSSKIAFHMDHFNESLGGYFSGTASDVIKDVYTVNLSQKVDNAGNTHLIPSTWAKVTNTEALGNGSYYPDFADNNELFYLSDVDNYFQFSRVNTNQLNYIPFKEFSDLSIKIEDPEKSCVDLPKDTMDRFLLGQIWTDVCGKFNDPSIKDSALISLSLKGSNCKELVAQNWNDAFKDKISKKYSKNINFASLASISSDELMAACPSEKSSKAPATIGHWKPRDAQGFKDLLKQKCLACHTGPVEYKKEVYGRAYIDENGNLVKTEKRFIPKTMPPIDLNNIDIKLANKLLLAVSDKDPSKRMPKGSSLKATEIQTVYDFTKSLELEAKLNEPKYTPEDTPLFVTHYSDEKVQQILSDYKANLSPELPKEEKVKMFTEFKKEAMCSYKQIGCEELIESLALYDREMIKWQNPGITEADLEPKLSIEKIKRKCFFNYDVYREDCSTP